MLSHTAGLSGWDEPLDVGDLLDHDKLVAIHAVQAPWWEDGRGHHGDLRGAGLLLAAYGALMS